LGEERADRQAPFIRGGGAVTGWQASSHVKMGRGRCKDGPTAVKMTHNDFFYFKFFSK
jgi:hypothetical protein